MSSVLAAPVEKDIRQRIARMEKVLRTFGVSIDNDADFEEACKFLRNLQSFKVEIQEIIEPEKTERHKAHKVACQLEDELLDSVEQGMAYLGGLVASFRENRLIKTGQTLAPQGVRFDEDWSAEVTDIRELLRAVLDCKVPLEAIVPNQRFLDKQANKYRTNLKYPGVKVTHMTNVIARKFSDGERDGQV